MQKFVDMDIDVQFHILANPDYYWFKLFLLNLQFFY